MAAFVTWVTADEFTAAGRGTTVAVLAGLIVAVPVVLRDLYPVTACAWSAAALIWGSAQHADVTPYLAPGYFAYFCCLYSVAVRCPRAVTVAVGILSVAGAVAISPSGALPAAGFVTAVLLLGHNVRQRRIAQLEIVRQLQERSGLVERQRLARELHDVVAHHMAGIAIQAEAAPYRVPDVPAELAQSLAEIRALALNGLTELRRILGVLRPETDAETAPQPGLDRYEELIASARAGGLSVHTSVTVRPLPAATGMTAYRILQEALSNVMKHAPGASVQVRTEYGPDTLTLTVVNDPVDAGPASAAQYGARQGLSGMAERAAVLGGQLTAGPRPGGGFSVTAILPLEDGP